VTRGKSPSSSTPAGTTGTASPAGGAGAAVGSGCSSKKRRKKRSAGVQAAAASTGDAEMLRLSAVLPAALVSNTQMGGCAKDADSVLLGYLSM